MAGLTLNTAPTVEPLTPAEAKTHLRLTTSDDDLYIHTLIKAARQWVENYTNRALINQTLVLKLDAFPDSGCPIWLPRAPLSSVTSITYTDSDGASQTLAASKYDADTASDTQMAGIYEAYNETWPDTRTEINAVTVTYVAGYGADSSSVPETIKHAMKLLISKWYCERHGSADMPGMIDAAQALLNHYKVHNTQAAELMYG